MVLNLYALMDSSFWFDAIHLRRAIVYTEGLQVVTSTIVGILTFMIWIDFMLSWIEREKVSQPRDQA